VPVSSSIIDYEFRPLSHQIDQRWLMAFAAAVGDARPEFLDTVRPGGIIAHPLFTLAVEWPAFLLIARELIGLGLSQQEAMAAVPLDYDIVLHRTIRPGETLATASAVLAVQPHVEGTAVTMEWTSANGVGSLVAKSRSTILFPGVPIAGRPARLQVREPEPLDTGDDGEGRQRHTQRGRRPLGTAAAHVFAECSGIWNPIHTDRAVALESGRRGITIAPSAVLAIAVGSVLHLIDADPACVRRVRATFVDDVVVPSALIIGATSYQPIDRNHPVLFTASVDGDGPVLRDGAMVIEAAPIDPADLQAARPARSNVLRWQRDKSSF